MNSKNLISTAAVLAIVFIVWKITATIFSTVFFYSIVAGAIYLAYVFFIAPMMNTKKD